MKFVVIDPLRRVITQSEARDARTAAVLHLSWPYAADEITDDHSFVYSPLARLVPQASFFWSKRLGDVFAGRALVFGLTVDGVLTYADRGMENALAEDVAFLGDAEATRRHVIELCKEGLISF